MIQIQILHHTATWDSNKVLAWQCDDPDFAVILNRTVPDEALAVYGHQLEGGRQAAALRAVKREFSFVRVLRETAEKKPALERKGVVT